MEHQNLNTLNTFVGYARYTTSIASTADNLDS